MNALALRRTLSAVALAVLLAPGVAAAAGYNESLQGDLSDLPGAPTSIGTLSLGDNFVSGSSIPSGAPIPDGHGALANQDNDFFTFTVPQGFVLSQFDLESDTQIVQNDRFFLGIYAGATSPVDPSNPSPAGLLAYTLPGTPQIGTDLLPALAVSYEPGFPGPLNNFTSTLAAGQYTVWLVDGDSPVDYDLGLAVSPAPEPGMWIMMLAGFGLAGAALRRRAPRTVHTIAS